MPNFDLSKWQDDYESAPTERDSKGGEVPDGKYQVRIARMELKESQQGNAMLEWELDIIGPRCVGRKLWRKNLLVSADNIKWLKGDLWTAGLQLQQLNDLNNEATLRKLIGVTLEVTKKTKGEYANVYLDKRIEIAGPPPTPPYAGNDDDIPF